MANWLTLLKLNRSARGLHSSPGKGVCASKLIDLKVGSLTHQDIGQMDGYVRMFDAQARPKGDNPTIGLILCSNKNEAIARYSVLAEGRRIFAAKYLKVLPSEDVLHRELERERGQLETRAAAAQPGPPAARPRSGRGRTS